MANPIRKWFLAHPESVGESYSEHFVVAWRFGTAMLGGGLACLFHALVPALFQRTGSATVKQLYGEMIARQPGHSQPAHEKPEWQIEYEI